MDKKELKKALKDTLPVLTGYLVLGFGFGVIMNSYGYSLILTVVMSILIYAGSMQYAAAGLMSGGASLLTVALTTLAVNARHLFYGISMIDKYKAAKKTKPYMIFALTDETYSLVCSGNKSTRYCFYVSVLDHCYWICGSALGSIFGQMVEFNTKGVDFALTALFITIFCGQWMSRKKHFSAISGVVISAACLAIFGGDKFLIPAMAGILIVLLLAKRKESLYVE